MSFLLFGTVSQCCDATFILDDIIFWLDKHKMKIVKEVKSVKEVELVGEVKIVKGVMSRDVLPVAVCPGGSLC